jgi:predicted metalloprotease with PDZ domain
MDSLKIEIVTGSSGDVRLRSAGRDQAGVTVVTGTSRRDDGAPFEYFVFRGEQHDSLRNAMVELNHVVSEIEARIDRRERELYASERRRSGTESRQDAELSWLHEELDAVTARSDAVRAAMAEAARETAGLSYANRLPGVGSTLAPMAPEPGGGEFRPLTPYVLGRNRVAGAEVIDLRPELAQYFEVGRGVLVVDVLPGTPASMAGIVPGDVITRLDQVGVRTVDDLRYGVSVAGDSLPISLVRHGSSVQVLLRR